MSKRIFAAGEPGFLRDVRRVLRELGETAALADEAAADIALLLVDESTEGLRQLVKARVRPELRKVPALLWAMDVENVHLPTTLDLNPLRILPLPVHADLLKPLL